MLSSVTVSYFLPWESLRDCLHGEGRERREQRLSSAVTKGITLWPVIPLLGAVGMTGEKKEKYTEKKLIYYSKGLLFPLHFECLNQ